MIKIKKSILTDELELPGGESAVQDRITGTSRWAIIHELIFNYQGKHYRTTYRVGATESQDESPWDDMDEVTCTEVHEVEKLVKVWEPVSA